MRTWFVKEWAVRGIDRGSTPISLGPRGARPHGRSDTVAPRSAMASERPRKARTKTAESTIIRLIEEKPFLTRPHPTHKVDNPVNGFGDLVMVFPRPGALTQPDLGSLEDHTTEFPGAAHQSQTSRVGLRPRGERLRRDPGAPRGSTIDRCPHTIPLCPHFSKIVATVYL